MEKSHCVAARCPPCPALNRSAAARVVAHTAPQSGRRISAPRARTPRGAPIGGPALPSCRRVRILCERDPLCPVPSPLHAAMRPLPLALAKILQRWGRVCPQPSPSLGCPFYLFIYTGQVGTLSSSHPSFGVPVFFLFYWARDWRETRKRPGKRQSRVVRGSLLKIHFLLS